MHTAPVQAVNAYILLVFWVPRIPPHFRIVSRVGTSNGCVKSASRLTIQSCRNGWGKRRMVVVLGVTSLVLVGDHTSAVGRLAKVCLSRQL